MSRSRLSLVAAAGLLLPAPAAGQTAVIQAQVEQKLAEVRGDRARREEMYEDIEAMRRLLLREVMARQTDCRSCHASTARSDRPFPHQYLAFTPDGKLLASTEGPHVRVWDVATGRAVGTHPDSPHFHAGAEGIYLGGQGVVYTLTLSTAPPRADGAPAKPGPKPVSDWERALREVRGEKPETIKVPPPREPTLTEILLSVLAENGRNFRHLAPDEQVTLVVTFRETEPAARKASRYGETSGGGPTMPGKGPTRKGLFDPVTKPPAAPSSARDLELLAELHLKQGRTQEAIAAYEKALELGGAGRQEALYRKLAQAYLALSETGKQDQSVAVRRALEYLRRLQDGKTEAAPPAAGPQLPARLTLSAPKKLLDQAGAGQMSLEEFRRTARVELLHFGDDEPQPTPKK